MAPMWSIFISYSHGGSVADKLIDLLRQELNGEYKVLVDKDFLRPGVLWAEEIRRILRGASVGVVLLDKAATDKRWVKTETIIMLEREMTIIPVLIGTTRKDLDDSHDIFQTLRNRQMIELTEDGEWRNQDGTVDRTRTDPLADVVAEIRGRLATFGRTFSAEQINLIQRVARCLPDETHVLANLIDALNARGEDHQDCPFGARELAAWRMLEARINKKLADLVTDHCHTFPDPLQFASLITPSWIPVEDADPIVGPLSDGSVFLIGPVGDVNTGKHYVLRATWCDTKKNYLGQVDQMPIGEASEIPAQLDRMEKQEPYRFWRRNRDEKRQYLVMRVGDTEFVTREAVEAVHDRWPKAVVVLTTDSDVHTQGGPLVDIARSGVIDVDPEAESAARERMFQIREAIQSAGGSDPGGR